MTKNYIEELETLFDTADPRVLRLPAYVKGQLEWPPEFNYEDLTSAFRSTDRDQSEVVRCGGAYAIRCTLFDRSTLTPSGEYQFIVYPEIDPACLIETDSTWLANRLRSLSFDKVLSYVGALRDVLSDASEQLQECARRASVMTPLTTRALEIPFGFLPSLLDPEALALAVDRELAYAGLRGRAYLDGWVQPDVCPQRGMTARMREQLFPRDLGFRQVLKGPALRALPTRQLHITAGNSPLMPFLSFLRALATKSTSVIKVPSGTSILMAVLALAMRQVDPEHPITRGTSFIYWRGGDRGMEDRLFAPGAFDRLVVWGSPETVRSIRERGNHCKTLFFNPRFGVSLIGREAFPDHIREAAVLAASDSMIANQNACTASLIHYLETSEQGALDYCRILQNVLAEWDRAFPHTFPRAMLGKVRRLRRNEFLDATWFVNKIGSDLSSLVIYVPREFDVAVHPMHRCVIVRRVEVAREVVALLSDQVSTIGIYSEELRESLCDEIGLVGVSNILPLGECERAYAGMPHDGMRTLSELVNWSNV